MTTTDLITKLGEVQSVVETHYCGTKPRPLDTVAIDAAERLEEIRQIWRKIEVLLPESGALHQLGKEMTELLA